MHQIATPNLQSVINQSLVFHYLKEHGPAYRAQVSMGLGISLPAVGRALDDLVEKDFVVLTEYKKNSQMRTVPFYTTTLDNYLIISIDAYNNLISAAGYSVTRKFDLSPEGELSESFIKIIDNFIVTELHKDISMLKSICIAFPGIVNPDKGIVEKAVYHPRFENVPIKDELQKHYGCTVFIDNVVNLAVLQNMHEVDNSYNNIVAVDIGMEIGVGILINGKIYRGENYIAGEIGFYTDTPIEDGKGRAHSSTLRKLAYELAGDNDESYFENLSCRTRCFQLVEDAFRKAKEGDCRELRIIDSFASEIALLINKIDPLLNPGAIVISGEICTFTNSEEIFLNRVIEKYHKLRFSNVSISFSPSGPLATLKGGVHMAEDIFMKQQFPYVMYGSEEKH